MTVKELKQVLNEQEDNLEVHLHYDCGGSNVIDGYEPRFNVPKPERKEVNYEITSTFKIGKSDVSSLENDKSKAEMILNYVKGLFDGNDTNICIMRDEPNGYYAIEAEYNDDGTINSLVRVMDDE